MPLLLRAYELWDELASDTGRDVLPADRRRCSSGRPDSLTVAGSLRAAPGVGPAARDARRRRDPPRASRRFTPRRRRRRALRGQGRVRSARDDRAGAPRPRRPARAPTCASASRCSTGRTTAGGVTRDHRRAAPTPPGQLVICPGAWAPQLLADLGIPFTVERQVHVLVRPDRRRRRRSRDHPIYIGRTPSGEQIYGFPAIDGPDGGVKVAFFRKGQVVHPGDHRPDGARPTRSARCATRVAELLPALRRRRPCTPRPACTPTPRTSTSSSPATRDTDERHRGLRVLRARLQVRARRRRDPRRPRDRRAPPRHPIALFDPAATGDHMTAVQPAMHPSPPPLRATLRGDYYTRRGDLRRASRNASSRRCGSAPSRSPTSRRPAQFRTVQVGRESVLRRPRPRRASCARSSTSAATAARSCAPRTRAQVKRNLQLPVPRLDLRPRRQARRRAEPRTLTDDAAADRPRRVRAASRSPCASGSATPGCAWPTTPPSFEDDVAERRRGAPRRRRRHRPLRHRRTSTSAGASSTT